MKTSTLLRIYKATTVVLLVPLVLLPFIFRRNIVFATAATVVITFLLILIAFQVQRLQVLVRAIDKLDELMDFLRNPQRTLSPTEAQQITRELEQIRFRMLRDNSLKAWKPQPH